MICQVWCKTDLSALLTCLSVGLLTTVKVLLHASCGLIPRKCCVLPPISGTQWLLGTVVS